MSKPDITLHPSKGVISEAAARIYAAYIAAGLVKDKETHAWIKRSIREAIIIAKTVNASVESHDELAIDEPIVVRPNAAVSESSRSKKESRTSSKNSRTSKRKSRASAASKPGEKKRPLKSLQKKSFWMTPAKTRCCLRSRRTPAKRINRMR